MKQRLNPFTVRNNNSKYNNNIFEIASKTVSYSKSTMRSLSRKIQESNATLALVPLGNVETIPGAINVNISRVHNIITNANVSLGIAVPSNQANVLHENNFLAIITNANVSLGIAVPSNQGEYFTCTHQLPRHSHTRQCVFGNSCPIQSRRIFHVYTTSSP